MTLWLGEGLFFLIFYVLVPAVAAVVGRAAWMGKPKNFGRDMYFTSFVASIAISGFLMFHATEMHARPRSWEALLQIFSFLLGAFLFGVAGGCMLGIFAYGRGLSSLDPPAAQPPDDGV